ncbi:Small secreted domain [Nonomuraea solani]|uniref:Small secreted domain n=1 Tax=Nonomuraea solani TaxID=1144553 RepID=A0A1H6D3U3_9ACTN|nr:chaplin family protein [Nonomuraea solani]SEG80002.1 Small secreted domain [Nonomuraea solani]
MRTWAKASTPAALLAVAAMSFGGGGTALADTSGDGSVAGGNQVNLPVSLPIDISGNSAAALGKAEATSQGGAEVVNSGAGIPNRTSGNGSVGGGNQVNAPISAPINACGNAVSLFGKSDAGCKGGATVRNQGKGGAGGNRTSGNGSVLGGNQVTAPISAPLNACGNAVAIFGDATAGCKGGSSVYNTGVGAGGNRTSGDGGVLGGNQVIAPVSAPTSVCGNAIAVFGRAFAGCQGGSTVTNNGGPGNRYKARHMAAGSTGNDTDGRFGAGSGNQVVAPVSLPVDVCGNAVGNATAGCKGGSKVDNSGAGGNRTSGTGGVGSGNQAVAPVSAPIDVCGNAAAVLGRAFAGCKGGAHVKNPARGGGGNHTSGQGGVLSGNQAIAPITAPINICGNAAAVLGRSEAHCKGGAGVWPHGGVGGGGNHTSGRGGVLSGNQVVAPIAAPVNICGNAAAVLGDAAAGCLGGSNVGRPGHEGPDGFSRFARANSKVAAAKGGMLPMLPAVPVLDGLGGVGAVSGVTQQVQEVGKTSGVAQLQDLGSVTDVAGRLQDPAAVTGQLQDVGNVSEVARQLPVPANVDQVTGLPVVGDAAQTFGLPQLPELPGLPGQAQTPAQPEKAHHSAPVDGRGRGVSSGPGSALAPATDLVGSTPAGGAVSSATRSLPVGDLGLMSAAQPAGVTGMNSGSLLALVLGSMLAASATLFGTARRFRIGRK